MTVAFHSRKLRIERQTKSVAKSATVEGEPVSSELPHPADRVKELIATTPSVEHLEYCQKWIVRALEVLLVGEVERLYAKYPRER